MNRTKSALVASLVLASAVTLNAAGYFFKDGDKVVMLSLIHISEPTRPY